MNAGRSRLLEAAGYACTRAAASLGVWDVAAVGSTDVVLLQIKTRDWPSTVEMEAMRQFPEKAGIARYGEPEEIAGLIAYLVSQEARWLTGASVRMDGGEIKGI